MKNKLRGLIMEILSNFSSIYCFITFIIGAVFMLIAICIVAMGKVKEPRNKVHFYVSRDKNGGLWLYLGKPIRMVGRFVACHHGKTLGNNFSNYGLNEKDYDNLKWEYEPVEVFLNLED